MTNKDELRKKLISLRDSLDAEYRAFCDNAIAQLLFSSEEYLTAKQIFIYFSVKSEVDTSAIIDKALAAGKKVAVPHCRDGIMKFYRISTRAELECFQFGVPTVDINKSNLAVPDAHTLCIVPALSFDNNGNRLGYGGGYYDRFLASNKVKAVGLCREKSLAELLPAEKHDVKINCIITEKTVSRRRVNSGE